MSSAAKVRRAWLESLPVGDPSGATAVLKVSHWASPLLRTQLVVRVRWAMLALLGLYGLYATALLAFSSTHFKLSRGNLAFLVAATTVFSLYNLYVQTHNQRLQVFRWSDHLQVTIDLLFVTLLIHFSGGAVSWFWPVYLLATIEAAFLLPRQRDVWMMGAVGGGLYGLLLLNHFLGTLEPLHMPFMPEALPHDGLFLFLAWCWVAVLNATVALITAYLMSVIREEHLALGLSQERLQNFVHNATDLIFCLRPDCTFHFVNACWQETLGYTSQELKTIRFQDLTDLDQQARHLREFRQALQGVKGCVLEGELIAKDGSRVSVEGNISSAPLDEGTSLVWCICRDVTQRKAAERQLFQMAHFDSLTGLPNRATSKARIEDAIALAKREGKQAAILYLDLDRFKLINDTLGHTVGDELLKAVGRRLKGAVREVDTVCRLGGDEFVVALVNLNSPKDIAALAAKLMKPLAMHFEIDGHELFITASMGISHYPKDGDDPETLIKKADIAMYHAKRAGRNNHMFYEPRMDEDAGLRLLLANDIRRALERDEFKVYYQPKHHPGTGCITSMEALIRWEHPEFGVLPPNEFIPLAEETGLIAPLGEWVLRSVAEQQRAWGAEGLPRVCVGVNLSGHQLQQANFSRKVRDILAETDLDPTLLEFEITETVIMQNPDLAASVLREFTAMGIRVSIDDFGTGYSSLAHLKRFSVSALKIDKSFIKDLDRNETDAAIATAIIAMASNLNLQVVAEGVETIGQLNFLRDNHCDEVQGYLFSEPVPADQVAAYLRTHAAGVALPGR